MKLFLIELTTSGWRYSDVYDSAVVRAASEEDARLMHPDGRGDIGPGMEWHRSDSWTRDPRNVRVTYLGEADPATTQPGVVLASFHAG